MIGALIFAHGCRSPESPFRPGEQIVVGLEAGPQILDPRVAQDAYTLRILPLVFEGLFEINQNSEPVPLLVESWEMSDDRTYRFRLKRGRRFADGVELTADDVIHTLESQAEPALKTRRELVIDKIERLEREDDYTLLVRLKEPSAPFLIDLTMGIVPAHADQGDREAFSQRPFGSGPYRVENYEPGGEVIMTPNPHYAGPPVQFKAIRFRPIPDSVTRVMALERGEVQLLQNSVPADDLPLLRKNPRLRVIMEPGINNNYLGFNLEDPILKNREVRQAIAHAIDREKIVRCLLLDSVTLSESILAPVNWAYNQSLKRYDYDPGRARLLLDEAGFPDPDGDGPAPRFSLVYKTSTDRTRRWIAEAVSDDLRQVGIKVEVRSYEFGTLFSHINTGNFQLYSLSWVGIVDPDIYYAAFHSANLPPAGLNRNRYQNPRLDELVEKGRGELDRERRSEHYQKVQELLHRDLPALNLWLTNNVVAMDRRLSGFVIYPAGDYRSLALAGFTEETKPEAAD